MDELRGFLILLVMIYHLLYDISIFFPTSWQSLWLLHDRYLPLRALVPALFILLCGISCHLSHNNLRRGILTGVLGLIITLFSVIFTPQYIIRFGILHLLATCILLYLLLSRWLSRVPDGVGILLGILLFLFTWKLEYGIIGINIPVPRWLWNRDWLFFLGFPNQHEFSADYFPLMPWGFLFLTGAFCGRKLSSGTAGTFFYASHSTGMAAIGRHTLVLYLAHQPIWFLILLLLKLTH